MMRTIAAGIALLLLGVACRAAGDVPENGKIVIRNRTGLILPLYVGYGNSREPGDAGLALATLEPGDVLRVRDLRRDLSWYVETERPDADEDGYPDCTAGYGWFLLEGQRQRRVRRLRLTEDLLCSE